MVHTETQERNGVASQTIFDRRSFNKQGIDLSYLEGALEQISKTFTANYVMSRLWVELWSVRDLVVVLYDRIRHDLWIHDCLNPLKGTARLFFAFAYNVNFKQWFID